MRTGKWLAGLSAIAALAVAAAGCGGSSESPQEKWANSICTPIMDWRDDVTNAADNVRAVIKTPSSESVQTIVTEVNSAVTATQTLENNLSSVGPPPTDNASSAQDIITGLRSSLQKSLNTAKSGAQQLQNSSSLNDVVTTITEIGSQLAGTVGQVQSAVTSLQESSSELKNGIDDADSCKDLRSND
jgi:hypothetical protein